MPNAPGQPIYDPEIQSFIEWVESDSENGIGPAHKNPFMPLPRLESYLKEGNRTKRLLRALFPNSNPPIQPDEVWRNCIRVFSILLLIGKGTFIRHFVQHEQLCDSKLPFSSPPRHFPPAAGDDSFFDAFSRQQWRFYPHTFRRNAIDAQIEKECILPIVDRGLLGDGGSSLTYKIKIYADYDNLMAPTDVPNDPGYQYSNTYVLKTYRYSDAKENYETEVRAFRTLALGGALGKSIIGFYGSFQQDGLYDFLLQYADRGTLEDYVQRTPPPTTGEDIYQFWSALFNVIKALTLIHNIKGNEPNDPPILQGWHQDTNPANILVTSSRSGSKYGCEFKIADLGLSHFREVCASQGAATDRDTCGTREYGAPECYRFHKFMERSPLDIKQIVDVWSLGCVFSEVAVWLVHGKDRLEAYRQERGDETSRVFDFRDGRAFHDSEKVLQSVRGAHKEVLKNVRKSDYITKPVVRMINEMLDEVDGRPVARQLCVKSLNIVKDAEEKLILATTEQPTSEMQSQRLTPPVVPPHYQDGLTARNSGPGRWSLLNHIGNRRSVTIDVPSRDDRCSPVATADAEHDSPEEFPNPTQTPLTSTSLSFVGYRGQPRRQLAHGNTYQSTSQAQQCSLHGLGQNHSPTQPGEVSTRDSNKCNNDGPNQLQDRRLPAHVSGLYSGDLNRTPSKHPEAGYLPSSHVDPDPMQSPIVQTTSTIVPPASSPTFRATTPLPYTSLVDAENWMFNKKQNGTNWPPLKHSEYLENLRERDHVFLVDDAATMSRYWSEVTKIVHVLSYVLKKTDEDGMDLYFTISKDTHNSKKSSKLLHALQHKVKAGTSDIGLSLSIILQKYKMYLQEEAPNRRRSFFGKRKPESKKALNLYVLTDAVWEPESNAAGPVRSLVSTLEKLDYPRNQVGIQFIRFGDDQEGIKKLEYLDSGLDLPMDIVDSTPADGNVWKMLLGSVNKWFDGDHQDINKYAVTQGN